MRHTIIFLFFSSLLFPNNLSRTLSTQGFTGLINTPNAQVLNDGDAVFQFNNQFDNSLRGYDYSQTIKSEENYIYGLGFLPSFEMVGRLMEAKEAGELIGHRDLSFNFKYNVLNASKYLPALAIGIQDFGGSASFFSNYYIATDKEFGPIRASLGYGLSRTSNGFHKRMDGLFGGVETKVSSWASVLAEHDGRENHAALRLSMPDNWLSSINVDAMVIQNISEPQTSIAINISLPLGATIPSNNIKLVDKDKDKDKTNTPLKEYKVIEKEFGKDTLLMIQNKLVEIGFENVQVGNYKKSAYIKVENNIFEHTDLDALGVILGTLTKYKKTYEHFIITLVKNNLQTMTMSGNLKDIKNYFNTPTISYKKTLANNLKFTRSFNETKVDFINKKKNSSFFIPRLELSPGLTTTVGTEVGLFDYLIGLRANMYTTLSDGLTFSSMYEIPLIHSQNFEDGFPFAIQFKDRLKSRFVNTLLNQTVHYKSVLNTTSLGQFQSDYYGVLNHSNFTTTSGEHGFNLRVGSFQNKIEDIEENRNIYLASYRYFHSPLDLFTEVTYGQFWNQDKGGSIELKRFFGDTSVSIYIKDTVTTLAGIQVSIPLTLRKLRKSSAFGQLKGKKDFSYDIRSVVRSPDGFNALNPGGAITPTSGLELTTHYLDQDRLNSSYIKKHLEYIREAYLTYEKL